MVSIAGIFFLVGLILEAAAALNKPSTYNLTAGGLFFWGLAWAIGYYAPLYIR